MCIYLLYRENITCKARLQTGFKDEVSIGLGKGAGECFRSVEVHTTAYVQMYVFVCVCCVCTLKCVFILQSLYLFLCSHHGLQQWEPQDLGGGQRQRWSTHCSPTIFSSRSHITSLCCWLSLWDLWWHKEIMSFRDSFTFLRVSSSSTPSALPVVRRLRFPFSVFTQV